MALNSPLLFQRICKIKCSQFYIGNNTRFTLNIPNKRYVLPQITQCRLFWERHRKGGYETEVKLPFYKHIYYGSKELLPEFKMWLNEMKELIITDPVLVARPGMFISIDVIIFLFTN